MQEAGVKPEIEVFDPGMIHDAAYYLKTGVLTAPMHFQFCMGCAGGIDSQPMERSCILSKQTLEKRCTGFYMERIWCRKTVAMEIMYAAIAAGGHIRVGMEAT